MPCSHLISESNMDYLILEFLKNYPEGATSAAVHKAVTDPHLNLAQTEDRLDDLRSDAFIVLAFIEGVTVYAIA